MKWFRLYHSVMDSVKVRTLPESAQLDYLLLLCCASEYRQKTGRNTGETGLTIERAVFRTRRETLPGTFPLLCNVVDGPLARLDDEQKIVMCEWERMQFASDDVASRTKKAKAKQQDAPGKPRNVPKNSKGNTKGNVRDTDKPSVLPNGNTAGASPAELTKEELWTTGKELLIQQGMGKSTAGSFIGHLCKAHGNDTVVDALRAACVEQPADLRGWLVKRCQAGVTGKPANSRHAERLRVSREINGGGDDQEPAGGNVGTERDITGESERLT